MRPAVVSGGSTAMARSIAASIPGRITVVGRSGCSSGRQDPSRWTLFPSRWRRERNSAANQYRAAQFRWLVGHRLRSRCRRHCLCHSSSQPDGRIVLGGAFLSPSAASATGTYAALHIGRLNSDGSVDDGFNPGADKRRVSYSVANRRQDPPSVDNSPRSVAVALAQRRATISGGLIRTVRWTSLSIPV